MERKHLLVLANSYKHHARCVAGRELRADGSAGPWIRPVSNHGEGELLPQETRLSNGMQAMVLQCVSIPLSHYVNDPGQPENWLIHGAGKWHEINSVVPRPLSTLVESPHDLWEEPGRFADYVSHSWLRANPPQQSLYLIRTQNLHIRVECRDDKDKWRAVFQFHGVRYNFSVTDPVLIHKYSAWAKEKSFPFESALPCGDLCLVCVSLGSMWQGKHYKLAATIFENVP